MKKNELIEAMADASGESRAAAARDLDALVQVVAREISCGGEVVIAGFGTFKVAQRSARTGRHPRTGEPIVIGASKVVKFVPAAPLKAAVSR